MNPRISEGSFTYYTNYEFEGFSGFSLFLPSFVSKMNTDHLSKYGNKMSGNLSPSFHTQFYLHFHILSDQPAISQSNLYVISRKLHNRFFIS
jgi:hypothetical protein